jgi:hypothetical protein
MAKYSLPMAILTDLIENLIPKKNSFLCANPLTVLRVFLDASRHSAFTHVGFFSFKKPIIIWATIAQAYILQL